MFLNRHDEIVAAAVESETTLLPCLCKIVVEYAHQLLGEVSWCDKITTSAIVAPVNSKFTLAFAVSGHIMTVGACIVFPKFDMGAKIASLLALESGKFVAGTKVGAVCIWNEDATRIEKQWIADNLRIRALAELPNNLLVVGNSHGVSVWDMKTGQHVANFKATMVMAVCVLESGLIVSGCVFGNIRGLRYNAAEKKLELVFNKRVHGNGITAFADCRNGKFVSASLDKTVRVWDQSGNLINEVGRYRMETPVALAVLPDGRLAVGFSDDEVFLFDFSTWERTVTLFKHETQLADHWKKLSLSVLADGTLACANSNSVTVWQ